jgi:chemotaxis signal transduction protein
VTATVAPARVIRLTTGGVALGLPLDRVFGVERADRIRANDQPGTLGSVVNRAGEWTVIELAECLQLPTRADRRNGQVVLLELQGLKVGLLVDRVSSGDRETAEVRPVPASAGRGGPFAGVIDRTDGPLLMLDPERLLTGGDEVSERPAATPPPRANTRPADRLLLFAQADCEALGGRAVGFGVPAGCVTEIIDPPAGTPVPAGRPHVREIVSWRGQPVSVIDLAHRCGVPVSAPTSRRVVLVRTPTRETVGLLAGTAVQLLPLPLAHLPTRRAIPCHAERVKGVFDLTQITVVIADLTQLTTATSGH